MASDRLWLPSAGNKTKRMATLEIVITLFKVYFRLNTLRLCKNLINAVNSKQFVPFDTFPTSQRVTYKYYTGRLAIFDENYVRTPLLTKCSYYERAPPTYCAYLGALQKTPAWERQRSLLLH